MNMKQTFFCYYNHSLQHCLEFNWYEYAQCNWILTLWWSNQFVFLWRRFLSLWLLVELVFLEGEIIKMSQCECHMTIQNEVTPVYNYISFIQCFFIHFTFCIHYTYAVITYPGQLHHTNSYLNVNLILTLALLVRHLNGKQNKDHFSSRHQCFQLAQYSHYWMNSVNRLN